VYRLKVPISNKSVRITKPLNARPTRRVGQARTAADAASSTVLAIACRATMPPIRCWPSSGFAGCDPVFRASAGVRAEIAHPGRPRTARLVDRRRGLPTTRRAWSPPALAGAIQVRGVVDMHAVVASRAVAAQRPDSCARCRGTDCAGINRAARPSTASVTVAADIATHDGLQRPGVQRRVRGTVCCGV